MNRRSFIRVAAAGGTVLVSAPVLSSCTGDDPSGAAYAPWLGPPASLQNEDIRLTVVSHALLAPSFQNLQPWWVSLKHDGIDVLIERHRVAPDLDTAMRQTYLSFGAFIEALAVSATRFGLRPDVQFFPDGEPIASGAPVLAIARVLLEPDASVIHDPLFAELARRRTSRTPFSEKLLDPSAVQALMTAGGGPDDVRLSVHTDPGEIDAISRAIMDACVEEADDPVRAQAQSELLRWTDDETEHRRDGLTLTNFGLNAIERLAARVRFVSGNAMTMLARRQTESAPAYGVISASDDTPVRHLLAGRLFLRTHLAATRANVALQPFSQPIEQGRAGEIAAAAGLDGTTPLMVFRLGYCDPVPPSPRRSLFEIVRI